MTSPAVLAENISNQYGASSGGSHSLTTPPRDISTAQLPDFPHPAWKRMEPRWNVCRALMAGTEEVRAGAEDFLPRLEAESDASYTFRLNLVALFPAFARTVKAAVGLINQTPPVLGDDMPPDIVALAENIDMAGTHLNVFAKQLTKEGLVDGLAGILVDYPRVDTPSQVSRDEEKRQGLRPYWVLIRADDVFKQVYQVINGVKTLVLLVLRETSEQLSGAFNVTTVTTFRVYRHTPAGPTVETWVKRYEDSQSQMTENAVPLRNVSRIPFAPFIAGDVISDVEVRPPLLDLAYLNLEHHNIKTNIRTLETLACVPTNVRIGAPKDSDGQYPPLVLGPRSVIEAPFIQGIAQPLYWHSPNVTVLDPANKSLTDVKADMGSAGLSFLAPDNRAAETAAAKRIDSTAQNATVTTVAGRLEDCLESAFGFTGDYMKKPAGSVTVNTDYENSVMDAAMVAALGTLATNGKLDIETLLDLLDIGHILPAGADKAAIIERILKEGTAQREADAASLASARGLPDGTPPGGNPGGSTDPTTGDQTAAS